MRFIDEKDHFDMLKLYDLHLRLYNVRFSLKAAPQMPPIKALNQRQQRWSDGDEGLTGGKQQSPLKSERTNNAGDAPHDRLPITTPQI
ncbi:hypothetical protein [Serratia marcescens]|uniref:hypothetical protein n=1 Tax=Serratia marcescens TaxID=615 RepID=UPI0038795D99